MELSETSVVVAISPQIAENGDSMVLPEYLQALEERGASGALIVCGNGNEHDEQTLQAVAHAPIDKLLPAGTCGILIPGGDDIDAHLYGQEPIASAQPPHPLRDLLEPRLITYALEHGIPLLGICRGMQMMNIVQGGTLIQSLSKALDESQYNAHPHTHNKEQRRNTAAHTVTLLPHTALNSNNLTAKVGVNSLHNQAVDQLGADTTPIAVADDNVVEALCIQRAGFAIGVQWHPELMDNEQARAMVLEPFIRACKDRLRTQ